LEQFTVCGRGGRWYWIAREVFDNFESSPTYSRDRWAWPSGPRHHGCGSPPTRRMSASLGAAKVAAERAHSSESGRTAVEAIMPLTCGDARERTSLDVLWPIS